MPDKDRSDADVVVFLAEEHAADNETDAQQRSAVCVRNIITITKIVAQRCMHCHIWLPRDCLLAPLDDWAQHLLD